MLLVISLLFIGSSSAFSQKLKEAKVIQIAEAILEHRDYKKFKGKFDPKDVKYNKETKSWSIRSLNMPITPGGGIHISCMGYCLYPVQCRSVRLYEHL